tara:strand:- start:54865 stop:56769 length:1905 start_codon:yes stop_codon:yes gene_type:complete
MKKQIILLGIISLMAWSCSKSDEEFLNRPPTTILTQDQIFKTEDAALSVIGDLYNRYVDFGTIKDWRSLAGFNISYWSRFGDYAQFQNSGWGNGDWGTWNYEYIRELNLTIERIGQATALKDEVKAGFIAEVRFLRASYYFEMVKRMGGVPLILEPLTYDFSGDPSYLQYPRETEAAIYDFVISEAEALKDLLPSNADSKSRATKGAALAMQARAALYAGSIAKYGGTTPTVSLPGGEVGIPAAKANAYYTTALNAAEAIINGEAGAYDLYNKKPDLSENFAALFYDKENPEAIFVEDFKVGGGKTHGFTIENQPRSTAEEQEGGNINPSLQFVQSFELLNGTYAPLAHEVGGDPVYYDQIDDIFDGRDARLAGTVILPGSDFKSKPVDIWAGYILSDNTILTGDQRGLKKDIPGGPLNVQVVGFDGPIAGFEFTAQTGFYIRKHQDPNSGSGRRGTQSDVWFMRYRFGEVLLNAAEAAFELSELGDGAKLPKATTYLNRLRVRAGLTVPLTDVDITFDKIAHERYVELAFEGLHFYDLKRWRIAHIVQDGNPITMGEVTQNIGVATKRETQPYSIWPYKYFNPGNPNDGKYLYKILRLPNITGADRFQFGNYYSEIGQGTLDANPLLVRNPNH